MMFMKTQLKVALLVSALATASLIAALTSQEPEAPRPASQVGFYDPLR
jgi:hypothetical protein